MTVAILKGVQLADIFTIDCPICEAAIPITVIADLQPVPSTNVASDLATNVKRLKFDVAIQQVNINHICTPPEATQ